MNEKKEPVWRRALRTVEESITAERFRMELPELHEYYGDAPEEIGNWYAAILAEMFAISTGLFALELPREEVPAALAEIREVLSTLDFESAREQLEGDSRDDYDSFVRFAQPLMHDLGVGMEALLTRYVSEEYDPQADPNELIAEALEMAAEDEANLEQAENLITEAGAIALHSQPLWWRWDSEAYGPAAPWLATIFELVDSYASQAPLGSPEEIRESLRSLRDARRDMESEEMIAEEIEGQAEEEEPDLSAEDEFADALINELIEREDEPLTPELIARCKAHRETIIPVLIDLATDEYLQLEGSPGEGYVSIRAAQLLGELKAEEAVPALIDIVTEGDYDAILHSAASRALAEIGPLALELLLDFYRYSGNTEAKADLTEALMVAGKDDERAYQALVDLWGEITWDEGKSLIPYSLAEIGGERAIPLLEEALEDPELVGIDRNEVLYALEELGVEISEEPTPLISPDWTPGIGPFMTDAGDPERLKSFAEDAPEEWKDSPISMAHLYTRFLLKSIQMISFPLILNQPTERALALTEEGLETVGEISFDASCEGYPEWLQETYDHLAECAGPHFQGHIAGSLLAIQYYLEENYDIADEPDHLLEAARDADAAGKRQHLFAQAGALILHGRSFWQRWPKETDPPLSDWLEGLVEFLEFLRKIGQVPLRLSEEWDTDTLAELLDEDRDETPPEIEELLNIIFEQGEEGLSVRQRRRFTHRRAAVTPHLIKLVENRWNWRPDSPGEGWAPISAAQLLGEMKAVQAADALVDAIADSIPDDVIHDAAVFSLINIGRLARPAVQAYFRYGRDIETKTSLAEVLGQIGRRNTEDFDFLQQTWEEADWTDNRRMVVLGFGDLRDRRAVPLLEEAMRDPNADALDLDYVYWALRRLGANPASPPRRSTHLKTPRPFSTRLLYDEYDRPQRLKYTAWGEALCPDCGKPMERDEEGRLTHP